jgi:hypothetical protein
VTIRISCTTPACTMREGPSSHYVELDGEALAYTFKKEKVNRIEISPSKTLQVLR